MDYHVPVLLCAVVDLLQPAPGKVIIDATLGHGGHSLALLEEGATVYGIDQDPLNLRIAQKRIAATPFKDNFTAIHDNFVRLTDIIKNKVKKPIDCILLDLGLSSSQQTASGRGFSFNDPDSLDMRLDPKHQEVTAENIINTASFDQLFRIFSRLAQERYSKPLILRIIRERQKKPIKTASRLANIVRGYYREHHISTRIDPSTKIFLALRITVNEETDHLRSVLDQTLALPNSKPVVAVISFHSTEDRIVKKFIQSQTRSNRIANLTPKPILPSGDEIRQNPLSRSAVLRSYKIE